MPSGARWSPTTPCLAEVVRSKVVEYVRRNNKPLYAKLLEWGVVAQEGCVECPILEQPALVMSPTLFC